MTFDAVTRERLLVKAAQWMFGKVGSLHQGWFPGALTKLNTVDDTNPGLTLEEANAVFQTLAERGFFELKPVDALTSDGKIQTAIGYAFVKERTSDLSKLANKHGIFDLYLAPLAKEVWGKNHTAIWAFIYALVLAYFAELMKEIAKSTWGLVIK